ILRPASTVWAVPQKGDHCASAASPLSSTVGIEMIAGAVEAAGGGALDAETLGAGDARRAKPTFTPPKIAPARSATKRTPYTTARFELAFGGAGATGIGAG